MENQSPTENPNIPFLFGGIPRKRKLPLHNNIRPSKLLITEVAHGLDNLQLVGRDSGIVHHGQDPITFPVYDATAGNVITNAVSDEAMTKRQTWADFQDDSMDIDQAYPTTAGRRNCPQLEMTESLKAAIKLAEQTEEPPLPESVIGTILRPIPSVCMALVPYTPPGVPFFIAQSDSAPVPAESSQIMRMGLVRSDSKEDEKMAVDDGQFLVPSAVDADRLSAGDTYM